MTFPSKTSVLSLAIKVNHNPKNFKWKAECPQCRAGIKDKDGISLFFHFPDSLDATQSQISLSADLLDGLDPKSNVEDVTRVGEYLENVVNDVVEKKARLADENIKKLLRAVARLKERFVPCLNKQKKDDATIKTLRDRVARLEFFETQATAYEDSNREAVDRADKLSAKNKALQKEVDAYKEERKLSAKKIKNTTELEAEIARLKSHCMKYKTNETRLKAQAKSQERLIEDLQLQKSDHIMEDSLQIGEESQYYELEMSPPPDDQENERRFDEDGPSRSKRPLTKISSRPSTVVNRDPLADHPAAHIMQDDLEADDMAGLFRRPDSEQWGFKDPKKRKLGQAVDHKPNSASKPPVPLHLANGRPKGAIQIGILSRLDPIVYLFAQLQRYRNLHDYALIGNESLRGDETNSQHRLDHACPALHDAAFANAVNTTPRQPAPDSDWIDSAFPIDDPYTPISTYVVPIPLAAHEKCALVPLPTTTRQTLPVSATDLGRRVPAVPLCGLQSQADSGSPYLCFHVL
ncbi:hypothetical protein FIBSPDRAFT_933956 [Athelia psychrophila]|uniref:Uncharacterized protein n=1 Tax=Athelia psychrophila TaxID=1759441 RepID=A0A166G925_9AGAM|nr:hypothetical protein FIBSPDRAFT_933956 [Fibularhizoctonia sp. CBS 109695]